jgi:hypothetical protein
VVRLPKASPKWPIEQGGDFGGGNKYVFLENLRHLLVVVQLKSALSLLHILKDWRETTFRKVNYAS